MTKAKIIDWFKTGKGIIATLAGVITFSIAMYNQFKGDSLTEISGFVSSNKNTIVPVDATVKIVSPIQTQTETDPNGRFKFKIPNLQSDTFLLLIQNKKTNTETKQVEYIKASDGKKDIYVVFNTAIKDGRVYSPLGKSNLSKKTPQIIKMIQDQFRVPRIR